MPDSSTNSKSASSPPEIFDTATESSAQQFPAPPSPQQNGSGIAESTQASTLPPELTPATTTRQSVALGVFSSLWDSKSNPTVDLHTGLRDSNIPSIITQAPSPDAQEPPLDLAASTSSVPSTATTLTNTLPPTQSAALRALNAPAFQSRASSNNKSKPAKSASSRTTLSSQPVVVRTYSSSRQTSRPSSGINSPRLLPNMNGNASQPPSALSAGLAGRSEHLPSVEEFSFSAILRAVDPEIRDAIDAIAEICARSRLSLANEYDAHLPPQGEITGTGPGWASGMGALVGRGRIPRIGQGWSVAENTLTVVPEASSSSERLAGESRGSMAAGTEKKRSQSAYGSLKSVISGGSRKRKAFETDGVKSVEHDEQKIQGPHWAVNTSSTSSSHPAITLVASPQASKQLSLDTSSTIKDIPETVKGDAEPAPEATNISQISPHRHTPSATSLPSTRTRSSTLSSLASWIPWHRVTTPDSAPLDITQAEARLREMLVVAQNSNLNKGKVPVRVA
ncbi:hypothetical protein CC78DRAFT_283003 [Lojkania enalia]|uniref:Uncharacterized protein n=1 Tax=Lojkania enalia TaxID=147567 RepID=A0A9P4NAN6_9PLEO|nr:hypothetical protein CC78DRAFT_283003 [Didymosphaeria enalia]